MLEVGNGKLTYNQNVSHFSLWCMMNSPLILGNDIREMSDQVREIVTNKALIAINQDPLCKAAKRVHKSKVDVLAKPLADGSVAVCFFNKTNGKKTAKFDLNKLCDDSYIAMKKATSYHVVEQWTSEELDTAGELVVELDKNASRVYIVR